MQDNSFSLISFGDINTEALGKPLGKLVETVSAHLEPWRTRRQADADHYAMVKRAEGFMAAERVLTLPERASLRVELQELRRQENIESVVQDTVQYLPETVNEDKVDPDWTTHFFTNCQDISNKQMQGLWAKILAGEVAQPGSYSARTLDVVKNLRKNDADLFTKFCSFVGTLDGWLVHFHNPPVDEYLRLKGFPFDVVLKLEDLGLINASSNSTWHLNDEELQVGLRAVFYGQTYKVTAGPKKPQFTIGVCPLTKAGEELFPLCGSQSDMDYLNHLIDAWKQKGGIITKIIP